MAHLLFDVRKALVILEQQGRERVPQVVEAYASDACLLE
jgi:hypothetical protein